MENTLNLGQRAVYDAWMQSSDNIFCTGHGGTGKSWLLRCIIESSRSLPTDIRPIIAVTAPTGAAAFNIGGMTINRFAGVGTESENIGLMMERASLPHPSERWKTTDVLIIDEISMVSGIFFENLNLIAQTIRENSRPFGGMRLLVLGDFLQLPPISRYGFRPFRAFECEGWKACEMRNFCLTETIRQTDPEMTEVLSFVRMGICSDTVNTYISSLSRSVDYDDGVEPVRLFAKKNPVESYNMSRLDQINADLHEFKSIDSGPSSVLDQCSAPSSVVLKQGAQVMVIKNISDRVVNGSVGVVKGFTSVDEVKFVVVEIPYDTGIESVTIGPESWTSIDQRGNTIARRTQIPLILSWAITIHKAQGKTIPRLFLNMSGIFEVGQAYVALSRCESPSRLQVINYSPSLVRADAECVKFYNELSAELDATVAPPPEYAPENDSHFYPPTYEQSESTQEGATSVAAHTNEEWVRHTADTLIMMSELSIEPDHERSETLIFGSDV